MLLCNKIVNKNYGLFSKYYIKDEKSFIMLGTGPD